MNPQDLHKRAEVFLKLAQTLEPTQTNLLGRGWESLTGKSPRLTMFQAIRDKIPLFFPGTERARLYRELQTVDNAIRKGPLEAGKAGSTKGATDLRDLLRSAKESLNGGYYLTEVGVIKRIGDIIGAIAEKATELQGLRDEILGDFYGSPGEADQTEVLETLEEIRTPAQVKKNRRKKSDLEIEAELLKEAQLFDYFSQRQRDRRRLDKLDRSRRLQMKALYDDAARAVDQTIGLLKDLGSDRAGGEITDYLNKARRFNSIHNTLENQISQRYNAGAGTPGGSVKEMADRQRDALEQEIKRAKEKEKADEAQRKKDAEEFNESSPEAQAAAVNQAVNEAESDVETDIDDLDAEFPYTQSDKEWAKDLKKYLKENGVDKKARKNIISDMITQVRSTGDAMEALVTEYIEFNEERKAEQDAAIIAELQKKTDEENKAQEAAEKAAAKAKPTNPRPKPKDQDELKEQIESFWKDIEAIEETDPKKHREAFLVAAKNYEPVVWREWERVQNALPGFQTSTSIAPFPGWDAVEKGAQDLKAKQDAADKAEAEAAAGTLEPTVETVETADEDTATGTGVAEESIVEEPPVPAPLYQQLEQMWNQIRDAEIANPQEKFYDYSKNNFQENIINPITSAFPKTVVNKFVELASKNRGRNGTLNPYPLNAEGEPKTPEEIAAETVVPEVEPETDVTEEDVTEEDVTEEDVTEEDVTEEDVTEEDVTSEVSPVVDPIVLNSELYNTIISNPEYFSNFTEEKGQEAVRVMNELVESAEGEDSYLTDIEAFLNETYDRDIDEAIRTLEIALSNAGPQPQIEALEDEGAEKTGPEDKFIPLAQHQLAGPLEMGINENHIWMNNDIDFLEQGFTASEEDIQALALDAITEANIDPEDLDDTSSLTLEFEVPGPDGNLLSMTLDLIKTQNRAGQEIIAITNFTEEGVAEAETIIEPFDPAKKEITPLSEGVKEGHLWKEPSLSIPGRTPAASIKAFPAFVRAIAYGLNALGPLEIDKLTSLDIVLTRGDKKIPFEVLVTPKIKDGKEIVVVEAIESPVASTPLEAAEPEPEPESVQSEEEKLKDKPTPVATPKAQPFTGFTVEDIIWPEPEATIDPVIMPMYEANAPAIINGITAYIIGDRFVTPTGRQPKLGQRKINVEDRLRVTVNIVADEQGNRKIQIVNVSGTPVKQVRKPKETVNILGTPVKRRQKEHSEEVEKASPEKTPSQKVTPEAPPKEEPAKTTPEAVSEVAEVAEESSGTQTETEVKTEKETYNPDPASLLIDDPNVPSSEDAGPAQGKLF